MAFPFKNLGCFVRPLMAVLVVAPLMMASAARAALLNPFPGLFGPDDGTQLFQRTSNLLFSTKILDTTGAASFGFYPAGLPAAFVSTLLSSDPNGLTVVDDFATGVAIDQNGTFRGTFNPTSSSLAFYISIPSISVFLSTENAVNPAGLRLAAAFPSLTTPDLYLVGFGVPVNGNLVPLGYVLESGVQPIPEPGLIVLLLISAGGLMAFRHFKRPDGAATVA